MTCVPACTVCTGVCDAPVQAVSARPRRTPRSPAPNEHLVMLTCGCRTIPFPLMRALGEHIDSVLCELHGWHPLAVERKPKRKPKPEIPGQEELIPF